MLRSAIIDQAALMPSNPRSRRTRRNDVVFGYLIPLAFLGIAIYQEIHDHKIDKYIIGALLVFGLGALGWRLDVLFEKYIEAKSFISGGSPPPPPPPQSGSGKNDK